MVASLPQPNASHPFILKRIIQDPGCKCKTGCKCKRCSCHKEGASCKEGQCGCKATCLNPANDLSFIFGPGAQPEEVHICFLHWLVKQKKKEKYLSLREIWEREEPLIWKDITKDDRDVWYAISDDDDPQMEQKAKDFANLSEEEKITFVCFH